jgi:PPP family 3-phenylpropionic acid transporter
MRGMDSQNSSLKTQSVAEGAAQGPLRAPLRLVGEVSLISALAFLPLGIYQPFFPLWLAGQNFDAEMIGLVMAIPTVLRVLSSPTLSGLADKHVPPRYLLIVFSLLSCMGWLAADHLLRGWAMVACLCVSTTLMLAVLPLSEVMLLDAVRQHAHLRYGRLRVWGSVSFMLANIGGGFWIAQTSGATIPAALALCCGQTLLLGVFMRTGMHLPARLAVERGHAIKPLPRRLYMLLLGLAAINASYAVLNGFGPVLWAQQGLIASDIGWLTAASVIVEVYVFVKIGGASSPRQAFVFMLVGAGAGILRWAMMSFVTGFYWIAALQILHALNYGLFHLGALAMVTYFAPAERRARAQGLMSASNGLLYALVMLGAGPLVHHYGAGAYWAMVPCILCGLVLVERACRPVLARSPI